MTDCRLMDPQWDTTTNCLHSGSHLYSERAAQCSSQTWVGSHDYLDSTPRGLENKCDSCFLRWFPLLWPKQLSVLNLTGPCFGIPLSWSTSSAYYPTLPTRETEATLFRQRFIWNANGSRRWHASVLQGVSVLQWASPRPLQPPDVTEMDHDIEFRYDFHPHDCDLLFPCAWQTGNWAIEGLAHHTPQDS